MRQSSVTLPSFDLSGRTAIVTGATSGLGHRFALILAKAGARVMITGRRIERLKKLEEEILAMGGKVALFALDINDTASIFECVEETERQLGPVDILVNNAGMNIQGAAVDMSPENYDAIFNTNAKGAFFMVQAVAKKMIPRGAGGRIINIASIGAHTVLPGQTVYCMTKAAVAMMTQSLARDWARYNVNVNAICPGYIVTEINSEWFKSPGGEKQKNSFPRRRVGEPSDLDGTLLLLASDHSRFITGSVITVDDGQSL